MGGTFVKQTKYSIGLYPTSLVVKHLNNDTRLNLIFTDPLADTVNILTTYTEKVFVKKESRLTRNGAQPMSLVVGDFNGGNMTDIVTVNSDTHTIDIYFGFGNISFSNQFVYSIDSSISPCSIVAADFNEDFRLDIVFVSCKSDQIGVLLGIGNGSFANVIIYSTGLNSLQHSVSTIDINNDSKLDIILTNEDTNSISVLLGHGNGTFSTVKLLQLEYGTNPFSTVFGDLNGDGKLDMAVANNGTDSLSILLQTC